MGLVAGYWSSQVVRVVSRLGLADLLAGEPRPAEELAGAVAADPDALSRLLRAAAATGLVREAGRDRYALTPAGECLLSDGRMLGDVAIGLTDPAFWRCWEHLEDAVRAGEPASGRALGTDIWTYYRREPAEGARFAAAMNAIGATLAASLAARYDLPPHARVVDVGGGGGLLLAELLARSETATGVLVDRPEVLLAARELVAARGIGERVELREGDFLAELPPGGDVYVLKSVLHNWDDESAARILANCHRAARAGSLLLVIGYVLPREPGFAHLLDLMMLVQFGGRERTEEEHRALLSASGYTVLRVLPAVGAWGIIEARRSEEASARAI